MKKNKITFAAATLILIFVAVMACMGKWQADNYESSILSIYAQQQDAYVQLVLDQINMLENRSDDEIVHKILGSLDTSDRKYWTLSKEQALLFVKDVMETNRYKGLTSESFFTSDSASYFLSNLGLNHVAHEVIEMEGDKYVASGVVFEYNGARYKICLLTNDTVILDNNVFLSAKISAPFSRLDLYRPYGAQRSVGRKTERTHYLPEPDHCQTGGGNCRNGCISQPLECVSSVYDAALCGQTGQAGSEKSSLCLACVYSQRRQGYFLRKSTVIAG